MLKTKKPCPATADRVKKIGQMVMLCISSMALGACASLTEEETIGVPVSAVGHYGAKMGVPQYAINGRWMGNSTGWGGGGGFAGGVALPRHPKGPVMITVKWETCDISHMTFVNGMSVDDTESCIEEWHETTIPVNFAVEPGDSGGMFIHFLPGFKVEAWVSRYGPASTLYPGPAYPRGPAPINPPMPGKNPIPPAKPESAKP